MTPLGKVGEGGAGVLTSFVLHFVAFTGHSLELYRVVTLSESLHTAKMILDNNTRYSLHFTHPSQPLTPSRSIYPHPDYRHRIIDYLPNPDPLNVHHPAQASAQPPIGASFRYRMEPWLNPSPM